MARAVGLEDCIHFPGQRESLQKILHVLDVFVLTSRSEGLPNVLIESQAAGVPVVAFDVGGIKETLKQGKTGFLVAERSAQAIAQQVSAVLSQPDWMVNASRTAEKFVRERFSLDSMGRELVRVMSGKDRS